MMDDDPKDLIAGLQVAEHATGLVVLHLESGRIFVCNQVGARIWAGLAQGLTIDVISSQIAQAFAVTLETAKQDAHAFVREMEHQGLLVRRFPNS